MGIKQYVIIKGTQDGLTLHLNDSCSYEDLRDELITKLASTFQPQKSANKLTVNIELNNRFLTDEQLEEIKQVVEHDGSLVVEEIYSNVISKEAAQKLFEDRLVTPIMRTVRSGQVLKVRGDLLLIGDVNPGGTVFAGGNIYILGSLNGNAHAGIYGNEEAVIAASKFNPLQIKIFEKTCSSLDELVTEEHKLMNCAYLNKRGDIEIDRLQVLPQVRSQLTSLKGEL